MTEEHFRKLERMYGKAPCNRSLSPSIVIKKGTATIRMPVQEHPYHSANGTVYHHILGLNYCESVFFSVAVEAAVSTAWALSAEQTVKQLRGVIQSGYKTIGVVTPFTVQARLIDQIAKTQFGQDFLDDIGFVSGTVHRLQGDERDAIVLSSVLSPGMSKSSARWTKKERNLLSVAVSRARRVLIVLGHPLIGDLGSPVQP